MVWWCDSGHTITSSGPRYTPCNVANDKLEYLDRHQTTCGSGEVLQGWVMTTDCASNYARISYTCGQVAATQCSNHETTCQPIRRKDIIYLDRHRVVCPAGTGALNSWHLTNGHEACGNRDYQKIRYTCCKPCDITSVKGLWEFHSAHNANEFSLSGFLTCWCSSSHVGRRAGATACVLHA